MELAQGEARGVVQWVGSLEQEQGQLILSDNRMV